MKGNKLRLKQEFEDRKNKGLNHALVEGKDPAHARKLFHKGLDDAFEGVEDMESDLELQEEDAEKKKQTRHGALKRVLRGE